MKKRLFRIVDGFSKSWRYQYPNETKIALWNNSLKEIFEEKWAPVRGNSRIASASSLRSWPYFWHPKIGMVALTNQKKPCTKSSTDCLWEVGASTIKSGRVNFLNSFEIWPQMTFWPWPNPTMMTPGSKAIHGPNLVHMGSRVNELWLWPRNDLEWPQDNFLTIFEIWFQMTF